MGIAVCQARLQRTTGLPKDIIVNTFHFSSPTQGTVTPTEAAAMATKVVGFYTGVASPNIVAASTLLSPVLATGTVHEVRVYDLEDAIPRAPIHSTFFSMTTGSQGLASELAVVVSFRAAQVSGVPAGRTRGRIYFGPLSQTVQGSIVAGDVRIPTAHCVILANAGKLLATPDVTTGIALNVWSETSLTSRPVTLVRVNDAYDIQRRRGAEPTANTDRTV